MKDSAFWLAGGLIVWLLYSYYQEDAELEEKRLLIDKIIDRKGEPV